MSASDSPRERTVIEARGISKHFGATKALTEATVAVRSGSVHALVGENGAGKSTLGKILAGVLAPDGGELFVHGERVSLRSPREALEHGIAAIGQEPSVVPQLSVAENVFLGAEPRTLGIVRRRALQKRYELALRSTGFDLRGDVPAGSLRIAGQQEVEILRALSRAAEVVIMDEPTAALSGAETERLHEVVRALAAQGKTILLISHFLREVLELADTVTVLRDGRVIRTAATVEETEDSLVEAMLGRPLASTFPAKRLPETDAPVVLAVKGLQAPGIAGVDLAIRAGEIVGLAGLVGAGRSELAHAVFGATATQAGAVELNGSPLAGRPRQRLRAGVCLIPESRKDEGLLLDRPVFENTSLASLGPAEPSRLRGPSPRAGGDRRDPRALRRPLEEQQPAHPRAVRWQPAEGAPGADAALPAQSRDRRRADARGRRRSEARDLRVARRARRRGARRPPDLLRARGDHRARPSRAR